MYFGTQSGGDMARPPGQEGQTVGLVSCCYPAVLDLGEGGTCSFSGFWLLLLSWLYKKLSKPTFTIIIVNLL